MIRKHLNVKGRGKRVELWLGTIIGWFLLCLSNFILGSLIELYCKVNTILLILLFSFNLLILVLVIIVHIRRWHDRNKSGWWTLLNLIPVVGWIWPLIECGFLPAKHEGNRYG